MHKWLWILAAAFYAVFCLGCAANMKTTIQPDGTKITEPVENPTLNQLSRITGERGVKGSVHGTMADGHIGPISYNVTGGALGWDLSVDPFTNALIEQNRELLLIVRTLLEQRGGAATTESTFRAPTSTDQPAGAPAIAPLTQ